MLHTPADFEPLLVPSVDAPHHTFIFHQGKLLLRKGDLGLPDLAASANLLAQPGVTQPVGKWRGRHFQVALVETAALPDDEHDWFGLRALFGVVEDGFLGIASRASQIAEWWRTNRFCGVCAVPMKHVYGERACRCPDCGYTAYPQICPAMMVLIRKGDQVLLALHANSPVRRYTALAGFLEAGESIEEAVHREVYEEVGLRVHQLRYFNSQSWPFPNSLMIAFTAEYLSGDIRVDPAEIEDARWFGPGDSWPEMPHNVSIASALLAAHRPGAR
jgi:NAD+ diphosphatase